MPLNEATRKPRRERTSLEAQLAGTHTLKELSMSQNSFLSDKTGIDALSPAQKAALLDELQRSAPVGREIDLSKPVTPRYVHQEFPKMVYNHESGDVLTVGDERMLKAAERRGFKNQPSPNHDYSRIVNGRAAKKSTPPPRAHSLTDEEIAELDAADAK